MNWRMDLYSTRAYAREGTDVWRFLWCRAHQAQERRVRSGSQPVLPPIAKQVLGVPSRPPGQPGSVAPSA